MVCDRNAIEIRRYGTPSGFPKTPKMVLIQAMCGRGEQMGIWWMCTCTCVLATSLIPSLTYVLHNTMSESLHSVSHGESNTYSMCYSICCSKRLSPPTSPSCPPNGIPMKSVPTSSTFFCHSSMYCGQWNPNVSLGARLQVGNN